MRPQCFSSKRSFSTIAVPLFLVGSILLAGCAHDQRPLFSKFGKFGEQSKLFAKKLIPAKKESLEEDEFLKQLSKSHAKKVQNSKKELAKRSESSRSLRLKKNEKQRKKGKVFSALAQGRQKSSGQVKDPFLKQTVQTKFQKEAVTSQKSKPTPQRDISSALASAERVTDFTPKMENSFVDGFDSSLDRLRADVAGSNPEVGTARTASDPEQSAVVKNAGPSFRQWLGTASETESSARPKIAQESSRVLSRGATLLEDPEAVVTIPKRSLTRPADGQTQVTRTFPKPTRNLELIVSDGYDRSGYNRNLIERKQPIERARPIEQQRSIERKSLIAQKNPIERERFIEREKPIERQIPLERERPIEQKKPVERHQMIITPALRVSSRNGGSAYDSVSEMIVDSDSLQPGWNKPVISLTAATVTEAPSVYEQNQKLGSDFIPLQDSDSVPTDEFAPIYSSDAGTIPKSNAVWSNSSAPFHRHRHEFSVPESSASDSEVENSGESLAPVEWNFEPEIVVDEPTPLVPFIMIAATVIAIIAGMLYRLRSRFSLG